MAEASASAELVEFNVTLALGLPARPWHPPGSNQRPCGFNRSS